MDSSEYEEGLEKTSQKTSTFGDVLKANLASQTIVSGVKKIASAVTEIGKASLEAYGDYEQLAGGAQLMFGEAYNTVAQNAKNAYKTVQMSQNDYLQQVNGFSTGLKTALGGNEQAAADLAHKIVVAEADVVAATGNTQEAVQNAFNGIMRSNYTMLDNLQLGITPTKEGFQQLIDKVNEWNAAQGNATNYTIANLADCQSALVDYIEMQGLAGYAGMEAAGTIQGSTASMKAAWENLATGMADETADMEELSASFAESVNTAAENIIPRVKQIVKGVATGVADTVSYLRTTNSTLGKVVSAVDDLVTAAAAAGAAMAAIMVGKTVSNIATIFKANASALAFFTAESGKAAVAQAVLDGEFAVGDVVIGVLTGKITLATAAQAAWNAVMSVNPYILIAGAVAGLAVGVKHLSDTYAASAKEMGEYGETAEEVGQNIESLKTEYQELSDKINASNGDYDMSMVYQLSALEDAIAIAESRYGELAAAEAQAAEEAAAVAEATANVETAVNKISTAADTYVEAAQGIVENWFSVYDTVYDGLYNAATAFTDVAEATKMSYQGMMDSLEANIAFNERYTDSLNYITSAAESTGVNIDDLNAYLAGMSTTDAAGAMEAIRAQIEAAGDDSEAVAAILGNLNDAIGEYGTSAETAGYQMAQAVVDVKEQMQEAFDAYDKAIQGLDNYNELYAAAKNSMSGIVSGINNRMPAVLGKLDDLSEQMKTRLSGNFDGFTIRIQAIVETVEATIDGSHASGLSYVPYDGYIAELHKGETVLTAEEAAAYRAGMSSGDTSGGALSGYMAEILGSMNELIASSRENNAAIMADKTFQVGDREFGRLVREYA